MSAFKRFWIIQSMFVTRLTDETGKWQKFTSTPTATTPFAMKSQEKSFKLVTETILFGSMRGKGSKFSPYNAEHCTTEEQLIQFVEKYLDNGVAKGGSFLFYPADSFAFLDDLERVGVAIASVEMWYILHADGKDHTVGDPTGPDFSDKLHTADPIMATIEAARRYVAHHLPPNIAYVSFVLDTDIPYWKAFQPQSTITGS